MEGFLTALRGQCTARRSEVVEKDFYLHRLLSEISSDDYLSENLPFKGGTCLVKAYLGHYRFSEDIDFTWRNSDSPLSRKSRSQCETEAETVLQHLKTITDRLGMRFRGEKSGEDVHFSSGGKMVTLWPTYYSELEKGRRAVKVELNFYDTTVFPSAERDMRTYIDVIDSEELKILFKEPCRDYSAKVRLHCYDCREIFIEKCRALMTRQVYKPRDSLDIYMMMRRYGYDFADLEGAIIDKVRSAIDAYSRYGDNLKLNELPASDGFTVDDNDLLLIDKPSDLDVSIGRINSQAESIKQKIPQG